MGDAPDALSAGGSYFIRPEIPPTPPAAWPPIRRARHMLDTRATRRQVSESSDHAEPLPTRGGRPGRLAVNSNSSVYLSSQRAQRPLWGFLDQNANHTSGYLLRCF